ncbi:hypothetical protein HDU85_001205 [Gaertneriomyces sp. JEL0708]|nr:hypothetical protein HDU85_001205 [Gaertneriomyces sp. JEL0708]
MSTQVRLLDEAALTGAIRDVRNDSTPANWVLIGHGNNGANPNELTLVATGDGGFAGLQAALIPDQVQYALLRVTHKVELSTTVKFVYIYNFAEKLSFVKKGHFGVVKGDATKYLMPFHVEIEIGTPSELTVEDIMQRIEAASGTLNNVRDAAYVEGKQERGYTARMNYRGAETKSDTPLARAGSQTSVTTSSSNLAGTQPSPKPIRTGASKPSVGVVATGSQGVKFSQDLVEATKDLRDDKTSTRWIVGAYQGGDIAQPITLLGSGTGGADEMKNLFAPDSICYGLIRVTDMIDGHPTVKFAFINFIGNQVGVMKKAKISTHKGGVNELFSPYHVDFTISEKREIDDRIIADRVGAVSGSRSLVK